MNELYLVLLFIVGVINFLPVVGVLSLNKVNQSYSLEIHDVNTQILLRHRAVLFGLVGGFIILSVFEPQYQVVAIVFALVSMLSFLIICKLVGNPNASLTKIAKIDIVGLILLCLAIAIKYFAN